MSPGVLLAECGLTLVNSNGDVCPPLTYAEPGDWNTLGLFFCFPTYVNLGRVKCFHQIVRNELRVQMDRLLPFQLLSRSGQLALTFFGVWIL